MEQYKSRWGECPQTVEEHINMIMGRYVETKDVFRCFTPKIGIFPYEACLENILCQRQSEIVRKRRRNFVIFGRKEGNKLKRFLAQKVCLQSAASGA